MQLNNETKPNVNYIKQWINICILFWKHWRKYENDKQKTDNEIKWKQIILHC